MFRKGLSQYQVLCQNLGNDLSKYFTRQTKEKVDEMRALQ